MIRRCISLAAISLAATLLLFFSASAYAQPTMSVSRLASGYSNPTYVTTAPGDQTRLFVLEKDSGVISIVNPATGVKNSTPFLTVAGLTTGGERGLLGLAFHPDYQTNGKFYINMTGAGQDTFIREYQRQTPDLANAGSANTIMTFSQPFGNHNGGWMGFGPDGYLHIATGDGGSGNDPQNNSQDITNNLLGKMLRIHVDGDAFPNDPNRDYQIPSTNPFVNQTGDDEILHYGIRNPWRASFDRETGDLYIGDVGQNVREEIDVAPAGSAGLNFGWRLREGTIATPSGGVGGTAPAGAIDPIYEYFHGSGNTQGNSVTGGYVYRGPIAALQGHYFFGDFQNRRIWSLKWDGSAPSTHDGTNFTSFTDWTDILATDVGSIGNISSFGEDEEGNLYVIDYGGEVFKIEAAAFTDCNFVSPTGCDVDDIDDLYAQFGGTNAQYDMNGDGSVDGGDIAAWLQQASDAGNPAKATTADIYVVGDVNLDGDVDSTDLGLLLNNFASTNSLPWSSGNLNGDTDIDSTDLGLLLNNFAFTSAAAAVPEPSFGFLSALCLLLLFASRRR